MYNSLFYQIIDAVFIILGKTGRFFNARGYRIAFMMNSFVCIWWLYIDIKRGLWAQACSVLLTICLDIYGWFYWGKNKIGK